jgi:RNA polymerase sigma factor (TIGR02999 family)
MYSYFACQEREEITHCLHEWRSGGREAENELFGLVFPDLCRLARYILKAEHGTTDQEPGDLVSQVYLRLAAAKNQKWQDRHHLLAVAARVIRRHIIDCARKRRKVQSFALEDEAKVAIPDSVDLDMLIRVRNLLDQLALISQNWRMIVELKYYFGLTDRETAQKMGIKLRTMRRRLTAMRQWLRERARVAAS